MITTQEALQNAQRLLVDAEDLTKSGGNTAKATALAMIARSYVEIAKLLDTSE